MCKNLKKKLVNDLVKICYNELVTINKNEVQNFRSNLCPYYFHCSDYNEIEKILNKKCGELIDLERNKINISVYPNINLDLTDYKNYNDYSYTSDKYLSTYINYNHFDECESSFRNYILKNLDDNICIEDIVDQVESIDRERDDAMFMNKVWICSISNSKKGCFISEVLISLLVKNIVKNESLKREYKIYSCDDEKYLRTNLGKFLPTYEGNEITIYNFWCKIIIKQKIEDDKL